MRYEEAPQVMGKMMTEEMIEEELDGFEAEYRMPMLEKLSETLEKAGISNDLTLGDGPVPGVWVYPEGLSDVFCTVLAVPCDDEEVCTLLRMSAPSGEEYQKAPLYYRWTFPVYEAETAEGFMKLLRLFSESVPFIVLPEAGMALNDMSYDGAEDNAKEPEELEYGMAEYGCLARLNGVAHMLTEEEEIHTGVICGELPYIQMMNEDQVLTLCYERDEDDEDIFLLHIRTDMALEDMDTGDDAEEICRAYNARSMLTRAYPDKEPFPLYGDDEEALPGITVHACLPEKGGLPDADYYGLVISLFMEEINSLKKL